MQIIAHRGASGEAPENTLQAFNLAWEKGADAIECDLRLTADGQIVALHDATLDRTTDLSGRLRDYTLEELRRLAPSIPTLSEILATIPTGKFAVLELKEGHDLVESLPSDLARQPVTFISFAHAVISSTKSRFPTRPALWLVEKITADLSAKIQHLDGLNLRYRPQLTQANIDQFKSKILYTYTVNKSGQIAHCQALGFDAVTTDFPGRAKSLH